MNFCFLDTAYSFAHIILCSTPSLSQGSFWGLLKTSLNKILNFPPPPLLFPPLLPATTSPLRRGTQTTGKTGGGGLLKDIIIFISL